MQNRADKDLINDLCNAAARVGVENSGLVVASPTGAYSKMKKCATEILRRLEATRKERVICDGCNVRGTWEHRCHGDRMQVRGEPVQGTCGCTECGEVPV